MNYFVDPCHKLSHSRSVSDINIKSSNSSPFWWIEITTAIPSCTYYFGPFAHQKDASRHQYGYIKDLMDEQACGIVTEIKLTQPSLLTITQEE